MTERISEADIKIIHTLRMILAKGNTAEVHQNKDGTIKIYEVKKHIA